MKVKLIIPFLFLSAMLQGQFVKLYDFGYQPDGHAPISSLITDGLTLYGMTNSQGTIFRYAILTGMEENNRGNIVQVIPNPNDGKFRFNISGLSLPAGQAWMTDYQLNIYNILGETIFFDPSINLPETGEVDISSAQKGIYLYKISGGEHVITGKIVIR